MACIIKELMKYKDKVIGTLSKEDGADAVKITEEVNRVIENLKGVQEVASKDNVTLIDKTALNPSSSIVVGEDIVPFVYKGKEFSTLRKAIDSWLKANVGTQGRTRVNEVNEVKEIVGRYLELNPRAMKAFSDSGLYFVMEDSKWGNSAVFEDALNSLKYDELSVDGRVGTMVLPKGFSRFSKVVNTKGVKEDIGIAKKGKEGTKAYKIRWANFMLQNPTMYEDLYNKVKDGKLLLVDPFAKPGELNPAAVIQSMIDNNWKPKAKKNVEEAEVSRREQTRKDAENLQEGC